MKFEIKVTPSLQTSSSSPVIILLLYYLNEGAKIRTSRETCAYEIHFEMDGEQKSFSITFLHTVSLQNETEKKLSDKLV